MQYSPSFVGLRLLVCCLFAITLGCEGGEASPPDGAPSDDGGVDTGSPPDSGPPPDAGGAEDGAPGDSGGGAMRDAAADSDATPDDSGVAPDTGGCGCDDGFECTDDLCGTLGCEHTPIHVRCPEGQYCSESAGCTGGPVCALDGDCPRPDPCLLVSCDTATRLCVYEVLDGDEDGAAPLACHGGDCDDSSASIGPGQTERCNGVDDDCDDAVDEGGDDACSGASTCAEGACMCLSPAITCSSSFAGDRCSDPRTDTVDCGGCDIGCQVGEACEDSSCACLPGLSSCSYGCFDLATARTACGSCGTSCLRGSCEAGVCACSDPAETACPRDMNFVCEELATAMTNCGACGVTCMMHSRCADGVCDERADWVKAFGADGFSTGLASRGIGTDGAGNVFALGVVPGGVLVDHDAPTVALASPSTRTAALLKLSSDGAPIWVQPLFHSLFTMQLTIDANGDAWIAGILQTSAVIGGTTVAAPGGMTGYHGVLLKLSGADGSLLWHRVLPGSGTISGRVSLEAIETTTTGDIVVIGNSRTAIDLGSGSPVAGPGQGFVWRLRDDGSHVQSFSVQGTPSLLALRDGELPVVAAGFDGTITVAGVELTALSSAVSYIVGFDATGAATTAFRVFPPFAMAAVGADVVTSDVDRLRRRSLDGVTTVWEVFPGSDKHASHLAIAGGRLIAGGRVQFGAGSILGRTVGTRDANEWVAALDLADGAVRAMGTIRVGNWDRDRFSALHAEGDQVWMSVQHGGSVTVQGHSVPFIPGSNGLAVVSIALPAE